MGEAFLRLARAATIPTLTSQKGVMSVGRYVLYVGYFNSNNNNNYHHRYLCFRFFQLLLREPDGPLLPRVPAAAVRVPRGAPVAEGPGLLRGRGAEPLRHLAVLAARADPLADVVVQLAPRRPALAAVHLAPRRQRRERVLPARAAARHEGPRVEGVPPHPLHVVGPFSSGRQRDLAVHPLVDGVEVRVGQPQARAVDGVQEVEDGVVQLRRHVFQR